MVGASILGDYLIGPYLLPSPLNDKAYLILQQVLFKLFDSTHVLPSLRRSMCYQNDWANPHCRIHAHEKHLNITFGQWWIGYGGPVHCPARPLDLSCMDFSLWGSHEEFCVLDALSFS
ncbi:uncharacterized protein TNCT_40021 [Trichonephila clavata]|uniref:Uncharacterized protein n=1 Tax=Trichonephila clavata TaxID=2740835 RepID=A0A8X6KJL2_TRICU|nr:uncharacterized protein TNCT_40021 [Trichonephila clavata]